jgi:hypothetical protein
LQGAEFQYPAESTTEMKASCAGFREHFIWYHLGFLARRGDNQEVHLFFAELCYDIDSPKITVETCTILGRYLNLFCNPLWSSGVGYLAYYAYTARSIILILSLSLYLQNSPCAASEANVHFVPRSLRLCTQVNKNLCVERRGNK